jgi:hypothetical protein
MQAKGQTARKADNLTAICISYYLIKLQMGFCPVAVVLQ